MAISNDEKIAWSNYKSKWITNSKVDLMFTNLDQIVRQS